MAGAIAVVIVIALTGGLLLTQGQRSPAESLRAASASPRPTAIENASASAPIPQIPIPTFGGAIGVPWPQDVPIGKTKVVWFIGLGAGEAPNQLETEMAFIDKYNATNKDNIFLQPRLLGSGGNSTNTLTDDLTAGSFDVVGPLGIQGRASTLKSDWLDLTDEITKNKTDLSAYSPAQLKTFIDSAGQYRSLPYIEYPAFIFYNKDLFASAGLPDLPTQVGEKYMGQDWTWNELATIAKQLTVDVNYRKSTDAGFDPSHIRTYGFDTQWVNDLRRLATPWGAGSYAAGDGTTAQIPPVWAQAWKWYYDAMWTFHFAPTAGERNASDMGTGATVATGRVAMDLAWSWGISSFGATTNAGKPASKYAGWDMGVLPSNNGATTDPIDTDSFVINKYSKNPDAAYKAMLAIMADPSLVAAYGGMPADPSLQPVYFKTAQAAVDAQFANNPIAWSVITAMERYAASPTHEAAVPNYVRAITDDQALYTRLQSKPGLNLNTEIANFKAKLQADFNSTG